MSKKKAQPPVTESVTTAVEDTNPPSVQLNDLASMVNIIDHAAKMGAFTGADLTFVGELRGRLSAFLQAVLPPTEAEPNTNDAE